MKSSIKPLSFALALAALASPTAFAQEAKTDKAPAATCTAKIPMPEPTHKVADVAKAPNKTKAVVDGVIIETVTADTYKLKDGNEIIVLDVDDDLITEPLKPGTKVRAKGKVKAKEGAPSEFDVGEIWVLEVPKAALEGKDAKPAPKQP